MEKITKEFFGKVRKLYFNFVEEIKLYILLALFVMVAGIFLKPIMTEIEYLIYIYKFFIIFANLLCILICIYSMLFLAIIIVYLKNYSYEDGRKRMKNDNK